MHRISEMMSGDLFYLLTKTCRKGGSNRNTMDLLNKKRLETEIKNYQLVVEQYKVINKQLMVKIVELYKMRKASVNVLNEFNEYIRTLSNNELFVKMLDRAEDLRPFQEMVSKEESGEICHAFEGVNSIGSTIAGATAGAAGVATAIGGQTALWATASAFGTTAGGTAIGTLVGVAETNAFLAWLGGGAIAAGGGGVAAGSAIFAAIPIVGWALAAIGVGVTTITITLNRRKNRETAQKVEEAAKKISTITNKIEQEIIKASAITKRLTEKRSNLNVNSFNTYPKNCGKFSSEQKEHLLDCCDDYIQLCRDINASIAD